MTELLQRVIAELEKLSDQEQDAIAAQILAELEDEKQWKARFEATTDDQWDRLVESVKQDIAEGTTPLEEFFPFKQ